MISGSSSSSKVLSQSRLPPISSGPSQTRNSNATTAAAHISHQQPLVLIRNVVAAAKVHSPNVWLASAPTLSASKKDERCYAEMFPLAVLLVSGRQRFRLGVQFSCRCCFRLTMGAFLPLFPRKTDRKSLHETTYIKLSPTQQPVTQLDLGRQPAASGFSDDFGGVNPAKFCCCSTVSEGEVSTLPQSSSEDLIKTCFVSSSMVLP